MHLDPLTTYLHRSAGEHGPVMLMYHAVARGRQTPDWPWAVSEISFCRQLDFLSAEGYQTVTMGDLATRLVKPTGRIVVITFDDGYVDNLTACDELIKRNMRASWFIVSGCVGQKPSWSGDGRPHGRLLNAAELRLMHDAGMEIGSHTVSHVRMPSLDDTALQRELKDSKSVLEDVIGATVSSFAYPYGAWDERCAKAVKSAGYAAACTTRCGWTLRDGDPYQLRRLTVFNRDSLGSFARKLYFGSHDVAWSDMVRYALRRVRLMR